MKKYGVIQSPDYLIAGDLYLAYLKLKEAYEAGEIA